MNKSDIEWCDYTWNPLTGCRHNCPYCYARGITRRFAGDTRLNKADSRCRQENGIYILDEPFTTDRGIINYPFDFAPTLHNYRLDWPSKIKNGANIFVGAMADIFGDWVPDEIIMDILKTCDKYPQHNYLFLTKNPKRYSLIRSCYEKDFYDGFLYGATITNQNDYYDLTYDTPLEEILPDFLSIEPIMSPIFLSEYHLKYGYVKWIIVGSETGNRKNKVKPKREWIENIVEQCKQANIPIFMKDSLRELMGDTFVQEFPEQLKVKVISEKLKKKLYDKCGFCGKELPMKEMTALLERKKRGESAKKLCYACNKCHEEFKQSVGDGEINDKKEIPYN